MYIICDLVVKYLDFSACMFSYIDAPIVDSHAPYYQEEEPEDGSGNCLVHTLEFYHMLEADPPTLDCVSHQPLSAQGRLREHSKFGKRG